MEMMRANRDGSNKKKTAQGIATRCQFCVTIMSGRKKSIRDLFLARGGHTNLSRARICHRCNGGYLFGHVRNIHKCNGGYLLRHVK